MAKTVRGRKIVSVRSYTRRLRGKVRWVRRHRRSTPN